VSFNLGTEMRLKHGQGWLFAFSAKTRTIDPTGGGRTSEFMVGREIELAEGECFLAALKGWR